MQNNQTPPKFPIPWAAGAGSDFIRSIPQASQIGIIDGAASLTDGFPPLNFLPVDTGGIPPYGRDMNGVLNQATAWLRWLQAGGPIRYDAAHQASIGGYPMGAIVESLAAPFRFWISIVDNNTTNPDAAQPGSWRPWPRIETISLGASGITTSLTVLQSWSSIRVAAGATISLPSPGPSQDCLYNFSAAGTCVLQTTGGAQFLGGYASGVTALTLSTNDYITVLSDGTAWRVIAASPEMVAVHGGTWYVTPGAFSWTVPNHVHWVHAEVWGGGGGGSGGQGSSGAGGGYATAWIRVVPGTAIAGSVGAGGSASAYPTAGGTGGTSTFMQLTATGGTGGGSGPGPGGVGTGGTLNLRGETGVDIDQVATWALGSTGMARGGGAGRGGFGGWMNAAAAQVAATAPGGGGAANAAVPTGQAGAQGAVYLEW